MLLYLLAVHMRRKIEGIGDKQNECLGTTGNGTGQTNFVSQ
jgi:hypothetical protein